MSGWKRPRRTVMLIGAAACAGSLALAAAAVAQSPDWHSFQHRHGFVQSPALRSFHLAERLAGLEVYLAITPEQQPQWRAFTAAAIAMVPERPPPAADAFAAIDQITARVQAMGAPAQRLREAADALKAALAPDQITRANAMWAAFHHHDGMGHDGHDGVGQGGRMMPGGTAAPDGQAPGAVAGPRPNP